MPDTKQAQRARRKTLFPLSPQAVAQHRARAIYQLRHEAGLSIAALRQVMRCTPEQARRYLAKGERLEREWRQRCTCPAHVDITFTGHLPNCPLSPFAIHAA